MKKKKVKNQSKDVMILHRLTCLRCGFTWFPKSEKRPKVCGHCKSYVWDKPYKRKPKRREE